MFYQSKKKKDRKNLEWAIILVQISNLLLLIWVVIYIGHIYDEPVIHKGIGDKDKKYNYSKQSKNSYILNTIFSFLLVAVLYIYFWFVQ